MEILTEPQRKYLEESISSFAFELSDHQLSILYFRLDDLIQYGKGAVYVAYNVVSKLRDEREKKEVKEDESKDSEKDLKEEPLTDIA